jgi:prevent-host-death family protein
MRTVGAREANQQFSRLLREAEKGREFLITRNGEPVARLVPAKGPLRDPKVREKALKEMVRLMERGLDLGGRRYTRDEMHDD